MAIKFLFLKGVLAGICIGYESTCYGAIYIFNAFDFFPSLREEGTVNGFGI